MFIPPASTGEMFIPPTSRSKMFIPPDTRLFAGNYALCAFGGLTRFYATVESNVMLCITIQRNIM